MGRLMDLPRPALACEPPLWARGGHLQTLAGQFYPTRTPELAKALWEALGKVRPAKP